MSTILNDYTMEFTNPDFKNDLQRFLAFKEIEIEIFLQYLMEINEEINEEQTIQLIEKLIDDFNHKFTKDDLIGILRVIHLFTYILVKTDNIEVNDITNTLENLGSITKTKIELTNKYITLIDNGITHDIERIILANSNNLFFPRLIDIKCAAAIKAITDKDQIKSYLPIASIFISVKDESKEKIYFQATNRDIDSLIKKLTKIQNTLNILEEKSRSLL